MRAGQSTCPINHAQCSCLARETSFPRIFPARQNGVDSLIARSRFFHAESCAGQSTIVRLIKLGVLVSRARPELSTSFPSAEAAFQVAHDLQECIFFRVFSRGISIARCPVPSTLSAFLSHARDPIAFPRSLLFIKRIIDFFPRPCRFEHSQVQSSKR